VAGCLQSLEPAQAFSSGGSGENRDRREFYENLDNEDREEICDDCDSVIAGRSSSYFFKESAYEESKSRN